MCERERERENPVLFCVVSAESHRPVVVEVAEFVRKPLHVVRLEACGVPDDVEVGGSDCSLTDTLTSQKACTHNTHTHTHTHTHTYRVDNTYAHKCTQTHHYTYSANKHTPHHITPAYTLAGEGCIFQEDKCSTHSPLWFGDDSHHSARGRVGQALSPS